MEDTVSISEAARLLKVSRQTIYNWVTKGKLTTVQSEGREYMDRPEPRIPRSQIDTLLAKKSTRAADEGGVSA